MLPSTENMTKKKSAAYMILKEIGEMLVAYELAFRGWTVSKNLGPGYDLHIRKIHQNRTIEHFIEVKTRDRIHTIQKESSRTNFYFSPKEIDSCSFAVCHLYGKNAFFILSQEGLKKLKKTKKGKAQFVVYERKDGGFSAERYLNKWGDIK